MKNQQSFWPDKREAINAVLMMGIFLVAMGCTDLSDPARPNVLLIVTDDQGYGDVGFHGNENIDTPNLNQLAASGVEIERFYVSPVCAPTRASLLTGRYHLATGTRWVTHGEEVMRAEEVTIAELLSEQGYRTGLFGKWHNGKQYPHDPLGQGFQNFFGFTDGHINNYFDAKLIRNQEEVETQGYLPDVLTDEALRFMQPDEPFFAMVSFNTPHSPFQVPDKYFDKYKARSLDDKNACIYGMVENIDDNIGRLLARLKALKKDQNTIVIFMSDNGPNGIRYNVNLKGIKSHVDEGGVRSPFIISYPAKGWTPQLIDEQAAAHIDVLPTLMDLVDAALPDESNIHGRSLVPLIEGKKLDDRYFFTHQVIRKFDTIPGAVRYGDWLLTLKPKDTSFYNLNVDPSQQEDLKKTKEHQVAKFLQVYREWFGAMHSNYTGKANIQIGHPGVSKIEFPAQDADVLDHVSFKGLEGWANDYFTQWTDTSLVAWTYKSVGQKKYEIYAELSTSSAGLLHVKIGDQVLDRSIVSQQPKTKNRSQDRVPRGEVYGFAWPLIYIGDWESTPGQNTITITISGLGDVELKSIQLKLKEEKI